MKRSALVAVAAIAIVSVGTPALASWIATGTGGGQVAAGNLVAPTNLAAVAGSPTHSAINVTFTAGANRAGTTYVVTRNKQKNGTAGSEVACTVNASPCVDSGLAASTSYTYTVKAVFGTWSQATPGSVSLTTASAPVATSLAITTPSNGNTSFGRNPSAATAGTAFIGTGYGTTVSATLKQGTNTVQTASPSVNQTTGAWSYATTCLAKSTAYVLTVTQSTPTGTATVTSNFTTNSANANC